MSRKLRTPSLALYFCRQWPWLQWEVLTDLQRDACSASLSPAICLLKAAAFKAGVNLPGRSAFHIFRHTYATWMRREAGLDTRGLVGTGAWRDSKSADRYAHVVVSEEAKKAVLLPTPRIKA